MNQPTSLTSAEYAGMAGEIYALLPEDWNDVEREAAAKILEAKLAAEWLGVKAGAIEPVWREFRRRHPARREAVPVIRRVVQYARARAKAAKKVHGMERAREVLADGHRRGENAGT